jgi:hypothetical protein
MDRNWLIRTKNNHILGPVSKSKIKELISNGSIKGDDEVCSGNGYWFFIKEKELVDKYIHGDITQDFNPVSECEPKSHTSSDPVLETEPNNVEESNTQVLNLDDINFGDTDEEEESLDNTHDMAAEDSGDEENDQVSPEPPKSFREFPVNRTEQIKDQVRKNYRATKSSQRENFQSLVTGNFLFLILIGFFILIVLGFYFRKSLLEKMINSTFSVFPSAYAQEFIPLEKKKYHN